LLRPGSRNIGMDKTALVATDFTIGTKLVGALDESDLSIRVALWASLSEYENWRFVLSSPRLDDAGPLAGYRLVNDTLDAAGFSTESLPSLLILKMSDPFIRSLRRMFAKSKSVEGMRLGGQLIGDRFVEDGLAYRVR
jgi:hypothetical protein